jgi:hypothetical protein
LEECLILQTRALFQAWLTADVVADAMGRAHVRKSEFRATFRQRDDVIDAKRCVRIRLRIGRNGLTANPAVRSTTSNEVQHFASRDALRTSGEAIDDGVSRSVDLQRVYTGAGQMGEECFVDNLVQTLAPRGLSRFGRWSDESKLDHTLIVWIVVPTGWHIDVAAAEVAEVAAPHRCARRKPFDREKARDTLARR